MKKLQLKIQDLKNPSILSHREIRNIMGGGDADGSGSTSCTMTYTTLTYTNPITSSFDGTCAEQKATAKKACEDMLAEFDRSTDTCTWSCTCR